MSGVLFAFGGYLTSVLNFLTTLSSVIWIPLVFILLGRLREKRKYLDAVWLGCVFTVIFLGGEPTIIYSMAGISFVFIVFNFFKDLKSGTSKKYFYPAAFLLSMLIFLGLSAFQLIPFLELLANSARGTKSYLQSSAWSIPPHHLPSMFVPYFEDIDQLEFNIWKGQYWLGIYYVGSFTVLGGILAFLAKKKTKVLIFLGLATLGLFLSLGKFNPVYMFLFKFLPGFGLIRYPVKFFFLTGFSLAVLTGFGFDMLLKRPPGDGRAKIFTARMLFIVVLSGIIIFTVRFFPGAFRPLLDGIAEGVARGADEVSAKSVWSVFYADFYNAERTFMFICVFALFLFLTPRIKSEKWRGALIFFILLLSFIDLQFINGPFNMKVDEDFYLSSAENIDIVKRDEGLFRICTSPKASERNDFPKEPDPIKGMKAQKERLVSNQIMNFGIYNIDGYGSMPLKRYANFQNILCSSKTPSKTRLLDVANVKYVVTPVNLEDPGYELINEKKSANLYKNNNYLPRVFLADSYRVVKSEKEMADAIKSRDFKPRTYVLFEEKPDKTLFSAGGKTREENAFAEIVEYSNRKIQIEANVLDKQAILVLSEIFYPGWQVYVNGKKSEIFKANYFFRGVCLGPGLHEISFVYGPMSFRIGYLITALTLLILAFYFLKVHIPARKNRITI